jgi:hypothetical protein
MGGARSMTAARTDLYERIVKLRRLKNSLGLIAYRCDCTVGFVVKVIRKNAPELIGTVKAEYTITRQHSGGFN